MGKTVESYRIPLESEINQWNGFARALRKEDREAFDEFMIFVEIMLRRAAMQLTR
jgi:hypothetical protein